MSRARPLLQPDRHRHPGPTAWENRAPQASVGGHVVRHACLLLWVLVVTSACAAPATPPQPASALPAAAVRLYQPSLPQGPVTNSPWSKQGCQPGEHRRDLIACVNGAAITRDQVDVALAAAPTGTDAPTVVQALVDAELLAQAAAAKGGWNTKDLAGIQQQRMAGVLLAQAVAKVSPATIADADVQMAYKNPQIRPRFDHVDAWFTIDAQLLCCSGDPRQCAKREEVTSCIDKLAASAQSVYQALQADPPRSPDEMWARTRVLMDRHADLAPAEVHFFYDKSKPHDKQKGYDVMVKEFAEAVVTLQPGQIHPPVRSPFGWHIPFLHKIDPAVHLSPKDPQVRKEIAENIVPLIREREAKRFGFEAMRARDVQFFYDRLDPGGAKQAQQAQEKPEDL